MRPPAVCPLPARPPLAALAALLAAGLSACGGSDGATEPPAPPPPPVSVTISPTSATVGAGGTVSLTAQVANATNPAVTWSTTGGTLTESGASATLTAPVRGGTVTVTATSAADPQRSASAAITVTPVAVTLSAPTTALMRGQPVTLTASVTGAAVSSEVTWTSDCDGLTANGTSAEFVAPTTPGPCAVQARSALDTTAQASTTLTVRPVWLVSTLADDTEPCTWTRCSLRSALTAALATTALDSVLLGDAGVGLALTGTITLGSALPRLTGPVHVRGPGAAQLTIDANAATSNARRVLWVDSGAVVRVSGVTLRGGRAPANTGGGGVRVEGGADLALEDVVVRDNAAPSGNGGGILVLDAGTRLTLADVRVLANRTAEDAGTNRNGGGLSLLPGTTLIMTGGEIAQNVVPFGFGGGLSGSGMDIRLTDVDVRANEVLGGSNVGGGFFAGAASTLLLTRVRVRDNVAPGIGGGFDVRDATALTVVDGEITGNRSGGSAGGAFVSAVPAFSMTGTRVAGNESGSFGGGLRLSNGTVATLTDVLVEENRTVAGNGAGVHLQSDVEATFRDVTVRANTVNGTNAGAGGVLVWTNSTLAMHGGSIEANTTQSGLGGGLNVATGSRVHLRGTLLRGNVAGNGGGGFYHTGAELVLDSVRVEDNRGTFSGGGHAALPGAGQSLVIHGGVVRNNEATAGNNGGLGMVGGALSMQDLRVEDNSASGNVGGMALNTTFASAVERVVVRENRAVVTGGAVISSGAALLSVRDLVVTRNTASGQTGGAFLSGTLTVDRAQLFDNSSGTQAGGVLVGSGAVTVRNSTISGNTTVTYGGGLLALTAAAPVLENVTISGNTAESGAGLAVNGGATLRNVTIVGNTATLRGGGITSRLSGAPTLVNVLLAGNRANSAAGNCAIEDAATFNSGGHNLSDDTNCAALSATGDRVNTPAGVSPELADNGGATRTHALQAGSAAIDAGLASACPATDQRGFSRQGPCDIGAFEFGGMAPAAGVRRAAPAVTRQR
jgi:hypothetical protein